MKVPQDIDIFHIFSFSAIRGKSFLAWYHPFMTKRTRTPRTPSAKRDLYQEVTDKMIKALESGVAPWRATWTRMGTPTNAKTAKAYRGINVFILWMTASARGYSDPRWLTFKQANEAAASAAKKRGFKVEKNARGTWVYSDGEDKGRSVGGIRAGQNKENGLGGTEIIFWKFGERTFQNDAGEDETRKWALARGYTVFNLEQCDDLVLEHFGPHTVDREHTPIEVCETIATSWANVVPVRHGGDMAAYSPSLDRIRMPRPESFESSESYYATLFHEIAHSTGHSSRLARDLSCLRSNHSYAQEELVAEFTACFLAARCGIFLPAVSENSASYLQGWLGKLGDDKNILMRAASAAQKAADMILQAAGMVEGAEDEEVAEAA